MKTCTIANIRGAFEVWGGVANEECRVYPNVPKAQGTFLQADVNELIHVKFECIMAEMLVKIAPAFYSRYAVIERGKKVIYAVLLKAMYGTPACRVVVLEEAHGKAEAMGV